ncbi:MAG: PfkB family carbohydrate kinase [Candidatus Bathyarchaeia archaeon]
MPEGLITGATHIDIFADTFMESGSLTGNDLPGKFITSVGGTAFNVCMGLRSLGADCFLVSAARRDSLFTFLIRHELSRLKLKYHLLSREDMRESAFLAIREKGDLFIATTASAWDDVTSEDIESFARHFLKDKTFDFMVMDCNVPAELQQCLIDRVPATSVYVCMTSSVKAMRFFEVKKELCSRVKAVFMNENEFNTVSTLFNRPENTDFMWFVTRGRSGVTVFHRDREHHFDVEEIKDARSFSGVGDAFAAGAIYALEAGSDIATAVQTGHRKAMEKAMYGHASSISIDLGSSIQIFRQDRLTGCLSRSLFEEEKPSLVNFSHVMLIDIDHFKKINDTYGHDFGDKVLKEVADLIRGSIRPSDRLYRYGGEEFLLMLFNTETEHALKIAERIRETVQHRGTVTVSIGVSAINSSLDKAIKQADTALYQAKNSGRNKVRLSEREDTVLLRR